eukprot:672501-Amphidinium_carterae.1
MNIGAESILYSFSWAAEAIIIYTPGAIVAFRAARRPIQRRLGGTRNHTQSIMKVAPKAGRHSNDLL